MNETKTDFGIMGRFEQPSPSDARDRDSHFEQVDMMIEIKLLHFLHGFNKGVNIQIVVIDKEILEGRHAFLLPDVLEFLVSFHTSGFVIIHMIFIGIIIIVIIWSVSDFKHILLL